MRFGIVIVMAMFVSVCKGQSAFLKSYKEKWTHQNTYMMEVLNMLDEKDLDYRPSPEEMTTRDLVLHIGANMKWLSETYMQGGDYKSMFEKKDLNKSELIQHMTSLFDYTEGVIANYPQHKLATKVDFFAGEKTMLQIFELMDDHLTHHKGQRLCI